MTRVGTRYPIVRVLSISVLLTAACVLAPVTSASADSRGPARVETPVTTSSPITSVAESVVRLHLPLPASVGVHPAACDWVSYLRYRDVDGPASSADADKVLIAQPGILEGAGAFDSVARNTVVAAARLGKHVEFWALDRRSNCLEDHTGLAAGLAAGNASVAVDYYYNHSSINGRSFAGYFDNSEVGFLANIGMQQTVQDEYDVLRSELPDPTLRKQKVLCGGHSLGGVVTAFFAKWDFDGNPGYEQCSGYFALDTSISTSLASLSGMPEVAAALPDPGIGYSVIQAGLDSGVLPRSLSLPVLINPETMNALGIAGLAAHVDPAGPSVLTTTVPSNPNLDTTLQILFSRDLVTALTGSPSIRTFPLTNDAVLGGLLDNNSQPLAFLQSSVGFFGGAGPIVEKDFPLPFETVQSPLLRPITKVLFGPDRTAIPADPNGPLYTWRNYNQLGAADGPVATARDGKPFTSPAAEVTDIAELASSLGEQPLDFTEQYFPTKLVTDISQVGSPQIAQYLKHDNGITANPTLNLLGGAGLVVASGVLPAGATVIAPGYHHIDVLTASAAQNNGKSELISTTLAQFASS